jgi:hypothetical protein
LIVAITTRIVVPIVAGREAFIKITTPHMRDRDFFVCRCYYRLIIFCAAA